MSAESQAGIAAPSVVDRNGQGSQDELVGHISVSSSKDKEEEQLDCEAGILLIGTGRTINTLSALACMNMNQQEVADHMDIEQLKELIKSLMADDHIDHKNKQTELQGTIEDIKKTTQQEKMVDQWIRKDLIIDQLTSQLIQEKDELIAEHKSQIKQLQDQVKELQEKDELIAELKSQIKQLQDQVKELENPKPQKAPRPTWNCFSC